ncbi:peptidase inhibitor I78 family protein [Variovorax sp. 54]|uniref:I78 family peptidase inhibitor n=1 Tax=Variovorax sp. 54 TaxID=2035212 RepID=UPI000C1809A9|nr:I78 family peptidase inhibitor [Variovorax sp. 54]PIF77105.1 peptidase inhibitor I78 family protein [Variovorax sp. 54]
MKTQSLLLTLATAALLAACAAPAPAPTPAAPAPAPAAPAEPVAQCNAESARFAVGQQVTPQLEAAARTRSGAATVRVLKPNQPVTMEFNGARLNLAVDARGRVTAAHCG